MRVQRSLSRDIDTDVEVIEVFDVGPKLSDGVRRARQNRSIDYPAVM